MTKDLTQGKPFPLILEFSIPVLLALVAFIYGRSKLSAFAFDVPNPLDTEDRSRLLLEIGRAHV